MQLRKKNPSLEVRIIGLERLLEALMKFPNSPTTTWSMVVVNPLSRC